MKRAATAEAAAAADGRGKRELRSVPGTFLNTRLASAPAEELPTAPSPVVSSAP